MSKQQPKYDHQKVQAALRKAERTAYGRKHGNTRRAPQADYESPQRGHHTHHR